MKRYPLTAAMPLLILLMLGSCATKEKTNDQPADWRLQSNIYEVNVRQYTPEGTFTAFEKHLPRLKEMGVEIIWFMPITPIGIKGRKMNESELGSYYAVRDYKAVNPEFGNLEDFQKLVQKAHDMGFKVIIDWVANHSAIDNAWTTSNPGFYVKDSAGGFVSPHDWTDVYEFDYNNRELMDSMTAAMRWWIDNTGIDGFRCDVAEEVGREFWEYSLPKLEAVKDIYLLAEGQAPWLHEAGFDATYQWECMHAMEDLCKKKTNLDSFKKQLQLNIEKYPKNAQLMYFTSNHDENSWSGTEYEKYGDASKALAVFTQTMYQSIPLIYSGQEAANKERLRFFVKDTITWKNYELEGFYKKLLHLRRSHPALGSDGAWRLLQSGKDDSILAYERTKGDDRIIVVLNLSGNTVEYSISDNALNGTGADVFDNREIKMEKGFSDRLNPFAFSVLEMK